MRYIALAGILFLIAGCTTASTTHRLPAINQVVYCPSCNADLYQRVAGTSRTVFKRSDYVQLRFDMPVPRVGEENICPLCYNFLSTVGADGVTYVSYRDAIHD